MRIGNGTFLHGDCLEIMPTLAAGSVDLVLCDLPYGTTCNAWDSVIPLEPLWREIWRLAAMRAPVVLTAAQPFTSALVMSQIDHFKYDMVWRKNRYTGNLNAKKQPLRAHESILTFYRKQPFYEPYSDVENPLAGKPTPVSKSDNYGKTGQRDDYVRPDRLTKISVVEGFDNGRDRGQHPTQKPVALFEYLIRMYSEPGALVLDMTAGSGTTAVAAERAGRRWIYIERDETYYWSAIARLMGDGHGCA